ncbi:Lipin N-terminal [Trinorchestia longiramus]|nr:Lipin N-terminal [Trinorchestia longiramus]
MRHIVRYSSCSYTSSLLSLPLLSLFLSSLFLSSLFLSSLPPPSTSPLSPPPPLLPLPTPLLPLSTPHEGQHQSDRECHSLICCVALETSAACTSYANSSVTAPFKDPRDDMFELSFAVYYMVDIEINGEPVDIHMKLGETGEAFFVQDLDDDVDDETITEHNYAKSDEEARSQDSGFEAEDNIPESQPPAKTRTLRLKTDDHGDADPLQEDDVRVSIATDFSELSDGTECVSGGTVDAATTTSATDDMKSQVAVPVSKDKEEGQKAEAFPAESRSTQSSELGVISRVPRQNSSMFVMKHTCTQTDSSELELGPATSEGPKKPSPKRTDAEKGFSSSFEAASRQKNGKKGTIESSNKNGAKNDVDSKSKDDPDDTSKVSRNQRRKRRRRQNYKQQQQQQQQSNNSSGGKKKSGSGSQSSDASTTSEVADLASVSSSAKEDNRVFAMDHLDAKVSNRLDVKVSNRLDVKVSNRLDAKVSNRLDAKVSNHLDTIRHSDSDRW